MDRLKIPYNHHEKSDGSREKISADSLYNNTLEKNQNICPALFSAAVAQSGKKGLVDPTTIELRLFGRISNPFLSFTFHPPHGVLLLNKRQWNFQKPAK